MAKRICGVSVKDQQPFVTVIEEGRRTCLRAPPLMHAIVFASNRPEKLGITKWKYRHHEPIACKTAHFRKAAPSHEIAHR
ncbi:hypothetical protein [Rhizobium nepotum]|uniref:hypothetical protein n=1 Tax=Rhizobium nepotum TaxID=1035271 RepID=UPI003CEF81C0